MKLNADFSQRVAIDTTSQPWVASPLPGVERRMLDRIGDEIARATSLVRYAPDSYFSPHEHSGGEEFLVLDGVFSDEHGDYGAGMYLRNPIGSSHKPFSRDGCTIFVKLWQMDPDDQEHVRIDTTAAVWEPWTMDGETMIGVEVIRLAERPGERVYLMRLRPGTVVPTHDHPGGEELFVLDGELADQNGRYPKGTWLRNPPGSSHDAFSDDGCTFWLKLGHLAGPIEAPAG
ncbi:MAG: cupin domain-containing protein [Alphaproteobacteria bacterium]|nr:cupin domain-containing protein [Alphaproteobacteria bacterium]